jgi:hypothetical protein
MKLSGRDEIPSQGVCTGILLKLTGKRRGKIV